MRLLFRGKIIREFAKNEYDNFLYLNFEDDPALDKLFVARFDSGLYYWTSSAKAEVDFVFKVNEKIYPLEVKAGLNLKSKSLKVYNEKYHPPLLSRTSLLNFKKDENICNYPLYAISLFPL
ncbi:DUF4143 domain-containing protein [bacterium]|nr:DUF4143 domain-containing protein [bacterium]